MKPNPLNGSSSMGSATHQQAPATCQHLRVERALCKVPHHNGVADTAAQFTWYLSDLMDRDRAYRHRSQVYMKKEIVA